MKALLLTAALLAAGTTVLEKKPYSINDPTWNDRFLVIQEFEAGDDFFVQLGFVKVSFCGRPGALVVSANH